MVYTAIAAQSTAATAPKLATFDTDSYTIKVDNCCTKSISSYLDDFIESQVPLTTRRVKGVQGYVTGPVYQGTIKWNITDDNGTPHIINLPGSYYVPDSDV